MRITGYILSFFIFLFLQVFLFNKLTLVLNDRAHIFLLFLLMLPFSTNPAIIMLTAFASGLMIDLFSHNLYYGVHSFSAVMMVSLRKPWVHAFSNKVGARNSEDFNISGQTTAWTLSFLASMIFIHEFFYYLLDAFSFNWFHITFMKMIAGTIISLFICYLLFILFYRNKK
jgi:hypothetical protein